MTISPPASSSNRWIGNLSCLTISAAATFLCWLITRTSLDFFLGGLALATLLTPPLCLSGQWERGFAVICGISLVWLMAVINGPISIHAWINCTLVLASFIAMMISGAELLIFLRVNSVAASAIITSLSLAWLTWPIWLNASGPIAIHPVFAINSACQNMGIWTEQRIAYHLTRLGQDIAYQLPRSVWPTVIFQTATALILNAFTGFAKKILPQIKTD